MAEMITIYDLVASNKSMQQINFWISEFVV